MNPGNWIDTATVPPRHLPPTVDAALTYLAEALGHVVYTHWTLARLKRHHGSLGDAKAARPAVLKLLLSHDGAVEYWERGRLRAVPAEQAPGPEIVLARLLHTHRRRFRAVALPEGPKMPAAPDASGPTVPTALNPWLATQPPDTLAWLARAGRFAQPDAATNTLGAADDAQALTLFLRDRAGRSPHTLRAYIAELRRLMRWCAARQLGPLSDLTRQRLLAYRHALQHGEGGVNQGNMPLAEATWTRALAVVASLYRYWYDTGYLHANPAAGLSAGGRARTGFAPTRWMPPAQLAACDAWLQAAEADGTDSLNGPRQRAIWALYRYAGVRLAELAWSAETGLPRLEAEAPGQWTLYVCSKGRKRRAIPLPAACVAVVRVYRLARGLPAEPLAHESLPLIHGHKGEALQSAGLYREVKAIFAAVAARLQGSDPAQALLLRTASPHWLRHAYARTLVVDHQVPLPAAQALLGHASVQTTAAYAKTDLRQLRAFVEQTFANPPPRDP
ncbi:tyrosine-type recombinase/integrase [Cupriavidus basilensis]|uniref:tyrosine-type recombinase/integrase n=1 Tax=Cupriavidus basilensis TaxID=68895 RepID=UPI00157AB9A3|nr:tyrosine-type recombinase/integrase [Cupriavidus basilensis]NUA26636.1 integrase [Cupriavidus basilensis]